MQIDKRPLKRSHYAARESATNAPAGECRHCSLLMNAEEAEAVIGVGFPAPGQRVVVEEAVEGGAA